MTETIIFITHLQPFTIKKRKRKSQSKELRAERPEERQPSMTMFLVTLMMTTRMTLLTLAKTTTIIMIMIMTRTVAVVVIHETQQTTNKIILELRIFTCNIYLATALAGHILQERNSLQD